MFEQYNTDTVRDAFGKALCKIAEKDKRIVLISGDSQGASKTKCFEEKYKDRSYNLGIAEQNMVSFAAGMAYEGFVPFVSTRAPFLTMRAMEQIRTCICYDCLPARFVGTGGGYCSGTAGTTHWALEDVAVMQTIGNMTVFETSDRNLIYKIMEKSFEWDKPMYIRLGRDTEMTIYSQDVSIELGKANFLKEGKDGYFIVSGTTVLSALNAAKKLEEESRIQVGVIDMFTIKPIDTEAIVRAAKTGRVIVAQDHNIIGGLGSITAQIIAERGISCKFKILGCPDKFVPVATADYLYRTNEYNEDGLVKNMKDLL